MHRWRNGRYGSSGAQHLHTGCVSKAPSAVAGWATEEGDVVTVFLPAYVPLSMPRGIEHGAGHPILFGLAHGALRWTEGRRGDLDCCHNDRKHRTRFLPEKPLRRPSPTGLFPLPLLDSPDGFPSRYALSFEYNNPRLRPYSLNVDCRPSGRRHDRGRVCDGVGYEV